MAESSAQAKRGKVPYHVIIRIAGEVPADPKTVRKVVEGEPVRGSVYYRIRAALEKAGVVVPTPAEG
jgi:hypothetical protein